MVQYEDNNGEMAMVKSIDLTDLIEVSVLQTTDSLPKNCDPKAAIHVSYIQTFNSYFLEIQIFEISRQGTI